MIKPSELKSYESIHLIPYPKPNTDWIEPSLEENMELTKELVGLGIPKGVTLIVGGGYHGKSTLLRAIERGVYPHIPGDGRLLWWNF